LAYNKPEPSLPWWGVKALVSGEGVCFPLEFIVWTSLAPIWRGFILLLSRCSLSENSGLFWLKQGFSQGRSFWLKKLFFCRRTRKCLSRLFLELLSCNYPGRFGLMWRLSGMYL